MKNMVFPGQVLQKIFLRNLENSSMIHATYLNLSLIQRPFAQFPKLEKLLPCQRYVQVSRISSVEPVQETKPIHKKKAVLAICASGEGTAQRIKELIERAVNKRQETELEVLALSIVEFFDSLRCTFARCTNGQNSFFLMDRFCFLDRFYRRYFCVTSKILQ